MKSITCIVFIYSLTILVSAGDVSDFDRANHLLYQKRFEEAVKTYTKFIIEHPDNKMVPAAQWTLANLKMDLYKQYEDALKLYEQIIHDHANSSWEIYSYETAGRCYETLEKWQEAAESYQKLFMKLKGTTIEYFAERRIGEIKRRLLNCYQQLNNSQNLIDLYQGFIKENPESVEDYFGLANAYLDLDQKELAAENFVKIVEYFPAAPQARQVHSQHKDLLETKKNFNWHLYEIFESGYQASRSTDYEKALTDFNQVLQAGQSPMARAARIQIDIAEYRKTGNAGTLRDKLSKIEGNTQYGYGGENKDLWDSRLTIIQDTKNSLRKDSLHYDPLSNIAYMYYFTAAYQPAITYFEKAKSISPDTPDAYNYLGYIHLTLNNFDAAYVNFRDQIRVDSSNANAYDSMAEYYSTIGDTTSALKYYHQACEVDATFANAHYMLGKLYQELKHNEKALHHLQKFLEMSPYDSYAPDAQKRLTQLESSRKEN